MNEDQLADILAQHLDALLEGDSLPEGVSPELAELLAVAQNLTQVAPAPRPEFGLALRESLLGPMPGGNGSVEPAGSPGLAGSAFSSHMLLIIVVSLAGLAVILSLLIGTVIFNVTLPTIFSAPSPAPLPVQTEVVPSPSEPSPTSTLPTPATSDQPDSTLSPVPTATPILDILPAITVTVEITIEPPALVPGSGGGSSDGGNGGSGTGGDHDRGHGNDPDHDDEDNPGRGGNDD